MFLVMRGTLVLNGGVKLILGRKERWNGRIGTEEEYQRFVAAIAGCIVWYVSSTSYLVKLLFKVPAQGAIRSVVATKHL